jgi:hypothetical protein
MVFYYIVDLVTSISLNIIVKCSTWVVCQSAHGVYYLYKKIKPDPMIESGTTHMVPKLIDSEEFVVITREEYNKLTAKSCENILNN